MNGPSALDEAEFGGQGPVVAPVTLFESEGFVEGLALGVIHIVEEALPSVKAGAGFRGELFGLSTGAGSGG
ncbi:MAG: hypothetical protein QM757_32150 [Paludibaculum sp.]